MTYISVGIVDYGVGNIKSVSNAVECLGALAHPSSDPAILAACDCLILPGVGAFPHGMQAISQRGLDVVVKDFVRSGRPCLGICLGMQMLMDFSTEFGRMGGLGLIEGGVYALDRTIHGAGARNFRLPNVGWLPLERTAYREGIGEQLLAGLPEDSRFYFIHSFAAGAENVWASALAEYEGGKFTAMVSRANVVGTQFHPEKSGPNGLRMLKNFIFSTKGANYDR